MSSISSYSVTTKTKFVSTESANSMGKFLSILVELNGIEKDNDSEEESKSEKEAEKETDFFHEGHQSNKKFISLTCMPSAKLLSSDTNKISSHILEINSPPPEA